MAPKYYSFLLIFLVFFQSCKVEEKKEEVQKTQELYTKLRGNVFGTTYNIIYKSTENFQEPINVIFKDFNNSLSTYIPTSLISKINQNDSTVVVDAYFIEAFDKAKRLYKETDGYFDPTIGKLINAYGFGSGKEKKNLTSDEIKELMKITGFDKMTLKDNKVIKAPEMEFNVNAYAKGLGIDVVGRFLESKNIKDYLVEIGGEIRARGKNSRNSAWKVAIDDPKTDGSRSQSRFILLDNQSMATSGNYRKFKVNEKGEKIVHTVNPKTGLAQENNLLSASVLMNGDCADVDAYATAFMAMGLEKTKLFLEKHPELKVVLLFTNAQGEIEEYSN
ncbi:FAD:protein FMN transferase [Tenacibaculum jejuense]|uniref:FAD:protein FMN transferase n=1 Tax=Tenacibaculum jejuense TaxID=584609 RepID=A0A238U7J7_9FLAO|nr:FAD:protein FMN transferase [Tenacibaculum jejuense]SNR14360.1 Thiamine biosynthesis lipoprotein ApbE [Tenacibaculum jejuense]